MEDNNSSGPDQQATAVFDIKPQTIEPESSYSPEHHIPVNINPTNNESLPESPTQQITEPVRPVAPINSVYPSFGGSDDSFKPGPNLSQVSSGFSSFDTTPTRTSLEMPTNDQPIPVVKVLSVRGVEYAMMSIMLWIGAGMLIYLLVSLISGNSSFDMLAFPISVLLVTVPIFGFLFLRLRKSELEQPSLRMEPSKRRFSQITQILAFLTCFFNIVTVVYLLIGMAGGNEVANIGKVLGSAAVTLIIAGGILAYYWVDEHKMVGR